MPMSAGRGVARDASGKQPKNAPALSRGVRWTKARRGVARIGRPAGLPRACGSYSYERPTDSWRVPLASACPSSAYDACVFRWNSKSIFSKTKRLPQFRHSWFSSYFCRYNHPLEDWPQVEKHPVYYICFNHFDLFILNRIYFNIMGSSILYKTSSSASHSSKN